MSEIVLRPYQQKFIDDIRNEFIHGQKRVVGVAPCGAGKTIMTGWMIRQTFLRNHSAIFFVHRKELIDQTSDTFNALHIPHGIIAGGFKPNYNIPVQIASVQTLVNRLHLINPPSLLVCDECHHILADTYKRIINTWDNAFLLGVTATPERTGGITLCDTFTSMVQAPTVSELIALGNLTNFNYVKLNIVVKTQLDNLKIIKGDYDMKGLSRLMIDDKISQAIVNGYIENACGKSAICYCVNVNHSQELAKQFNDAGVSAMHCDGNTSKLDREIIVDDFRRGKYKILCNAELFGEGFDVPNCHAVILARPTKSKILHIQQSMRSMRPDPNDPDKVAVIIDCVGNYARHGLPNDPQDWSLDINKPKQDGEAPFKTCPFCGNEIPLAADICPVCGKKLVPDEKVDSLSCNQVIYSSLDNKPNFESFYHAPVIHALTFEEQFDELVNFGKNSPKINKPLRWAAYQMSKSAKNFDDLVTLRKLAGMKYGWEFHQAEALHIPIPKNKKSLQKSPSTFTI